MDLPSLARLSLAGPSHCRPCATDKLVYYKDADALRDEGAKHLSEFPGEPGEPAEPGCAICQLPFEPGRNDEVIILSCGHAFHRDCMIDWGDELRKNNRTVTCPLCKKPPTDAEMRELGYTVIDPMDELFERYLKGNAQGFFKLWDSKTAELNRSAPGSTSADAEWSFLEGRGGGRGIGSITYRPSSFTGARAGMSYIEAMIHSWAYHDGTPGWFNTLLGKGRILSAIFRDGGPAGLPTRNKLTDSNPEWNQEKIVSFFTYPNAEGRPLPLINSDTKWTHDALGEGWKTISQRAAAVEAPWQRGGVPVDFLNSLAESGFADVLGLVFRDARMHWEGPFTIKHSLFEYGDRRLRRFFKGQGTPSDWFMGDDYGKVLDEWYFKAQILGFTFPHKLAVDFADELGKARKVEMWKLRMLKRLLIKFLKEKRPAADNFEKDSNGRISKTKFNLEDQFSKQKQTIEHVAEAFKLNLDDCGTNWDEFLVFNDSMSEEEKWKRLDEIVVLVRDPFGTPDTYRNELAELKAIIVDVHKKAVERLGSIAA